MDDIGDLHSHFRESQALFEGHRSMFDLLEKEGIFFIVIQHLEALQMFAHLCLHRVQTGCTCLVKHVTREHAAQFQQKASSST